MSSPTIPPGQSAPVETITATHHGAWVVIATALGLVSGIVCILIRVYVRAIITPPFGRDDYVHVAATAFAIIQSIVVFWEVSQGFGTSIELIGSNLRSIQQAWVASDILFLITLYVSKCSLIFLFLRLTPSKIQNEAAYATLGLSTVWVIASAFSVAINCELNRPWVNIADQCTNMMVRWWFVTVVDIVIEVILVCLAEVLVHDLKMPLTRKFVVVVAFLFRLPLIAFVLLRLHYLAKGIHSLNPTLELVGAVVWTQIEISYSMVSGTIPCLRPFMMAVSTDYGATEPRTALGSKAYTSSGSVNRKGNGYIVNAIGSEGGQKMNLENNPSVFRKAGRGASRICSSDNMSRSELSTNKSMTVHEGSHDSKSMESNDSRKMIIKKEMDFRAVDEEMGNANQTSGPRGHAI